MAPRLSDAALREACGFTAAEAAALVDLCTPTSPAHANWARWWAVYAGVTFTTGAVLDVVAYRRHGYPATLTCCLRRLSGADPVRYRRAGQVAMIGFLSWATLHLGLGILGPTRGKEQAGG